MDDSTLKKLTSLAQLDIDAVNGYDQALEHVEGGQVAATLRTFREDHQRHVDRLNALISKYGGDPPEQKPDLKGYLLEGLTAMRSATGTEGALKALDMNEKQTNKRYDEAAHWDVPEDVNVTIEQNRQDEVRHLDYVQSQLHTKA